MTDEPYVCPKCGHNRFLDVMMGTVNRITRKTAREQRADDFRWANHHRVVVCARCLQVTGIRPHLDIHRESLDPGRLRRTRWGKA
jgi:hypothetical protein